MESARKAWTDERLDDLAAALKPLPAQVARVTEAVERLTDETWSLREETRSLREETRFIRQDLSASQRQIAQIGWALALALLGAIAALLVALI
jgi:hypothetical protein